MFEKRIALRCVLLTAAACAGVLSVGIYLTSAKARTPSRSPAEQVLRRQQPLPREAVVALQDLRLAAAVELTHFTAKGRYGSIDELKSAGFLDPAWPRSDPGSYRVTCGPDEGNQGFVCYADPHSPQSIHFRIDATQALRQKRGQRPDAGSPVFQ